jgi:transcriptional regulator with XRE-family HTH domain
VFAQNVGILQTMPTEAEPFRDFGSRLKAGMARANLRIADISRALSVSPEMVRRYREGIAMPRVEKLDRLAKLLGMTPAELQYGQVKDTAHPGVVPRQVTASPDEQRLLELYRQMPDYARKALMARAVELLEHFAPKTSANPYGRGR